MRSGYIKYDGRIIKIIVLEDRDNDLVVQTEDNELLCIPSSSNTHIWPTYEDCDRHENQCFDWIPM